MMEKIMSATVYCICLQYTSKMVSIKEEVNSMAQIQIYIMIVLACSLLTIASVARTCVFESIHE
jgi:hypothetical protein